MSHLVETLHHLLDSYGLVALFATLFLETFGLPLPGESALVAMAAGAAKGNFNIYSVALVAICASVAGDNVAFWIGRRFGRELVLTYGQRVGLTEARYLQVEQATWKYGAYAVVIARFFLLLRQLNGLVAGTANMHWLKFLIANILGATLWVLFWTTLAYQFGMNTSVIIDLLHKYALPVAAVMLIILASGLLLWRIHRKARHAGR